MGVFLLLLQYMFSFGNLIYIITCILKKLTSIIINEYINILCVRQKFLMLSITHQIHHLLEGKMDQMLRFCPQASMGKLYSFSKFVKQVRQWAMGILDELFRPILRPLTLTLPTTSYIQTALQPFSSSTALRKVCRMHAQLAKSTQSGLRLVPFSSCNFVS